MSLPAELSAGERSACAVCADWLATGALWSHMALLAMLAVLLAAAAGTRLGSTPGVLAALLALGVIERCVALRVAFDARLFDRLARGDLQGLAALDAALQQVLSVPAAKAGRGLPPRIAGARRLYRAQVLATLLLAALNIVAWWR
jgi:hypothetical protein